MKIKQVYHGFTLQNIREVPDLKGELYEFIHNKTGAKLNWIKTDDTNKTFAIAFKTLPFDDTGVFHILEHSVLNGSKKYRTREPFVDLLKHSMQTFLNAMTYPDKTVYPVSSRNDKDFINLMSVYMDAVFNPAIYENKNIFLQEGWRYEIRDEKEMPKFNGVVLNEMKGAFSDVHTNIYDELFRQLYPTNSYKYVSGGDPQAIPDLTYEKFLATHKKFYHPSNARVILDGSLNIEEVLNFIDKEYFAHYDKGQTFKIDNQEIQAAHTSTIEFEIADNENLKNRSYIALGKIIGQFNELKKRIALNIVHSILAGTNESPLKKAILDANLAEDLEYSVEAELQQPFSTLIVVNTDESKLSKIKQVIHEVVDNYQFDAKELSATINSMEFQYREKSEPAGLLNALHSLETWLYDGDPIDGINQSYIFEELRKDINDGYFEKIMKDFYSDEEHWVTVIAKPSTEIAHQRAEKMNNRLQHDKENWQDIKPYIAEQLALDKWQATADTKEQKETMPKLSLSDVNPKIMTYETNEAEYLGTKVLIHKADPSGIVHFNYYFSLAGLQKDQLAMVSFFAKQLLANLATENYTLSELNRELKNLVPVLSTNVIAYTPYGQIEGTKPYLEVTASTLAKNVKPAINLIKEILFKTKFNKEDIFNLLKQNNESYRQTLVHSGNVFAMIRARSHISAEGFFTEETKGISYAQKMQYLEDHFDQEWDYLHDQLEQFVDVLFSKDRFILSIAGVKQEEFKDFILDLHNIPAKGTIVHYLPTDEKKEYIDISGGVSYTAMAIPLNKYDIRYQAIAHLVTFDFLWTEVRVKGGAYGTGMQSDRFCLSTYSYRDPNPLSALATNERIADYLEDFAHDNETDSDANIIGTIAAMEPLMNYRSQIKVGDVLNITAYSDTIRQKERDTLLAMKKEDYELLAKEIRNIIKNNYIVVVGNEAATKQLKGYKKLVIK